MNLSELVIPAAPGFTATVPMPATPGQEAGKTALFHEFAQAFSLQISGHVQHPAPESGELAALPDGKPLPDTDGNILPDLAAEHGFTLPVAIPDPENSGSVNDSGPHSGAPVAMLPIAPVQATITLAAQPEQTPSQSDVGAAIHTKADNLHKGEAQALPIRAQTAFPTRVADTPGADRSQVQRLAPEIDVPTPQVAQLQALPGAPARLSKIASLVHAEPGQRTTSPAAQTPAAAQPASPATAATAPAQQVEHIRKLTLELPLHRANLVVSSLPPAHSPLLPELRARAPMDKALPQDEQTEQANRPTSSPGTPPSLARNITAAPMPTMAPAQHVAERAESSATGQPQQAASASLAPAPHSQPASVLPLATEPARLATQPASEPSPAPTPQRHDFGQVVERLTEAREMARPGRAEMQVTHREFGPVSMQFDVTGGALKVALANAHAGFAPAVQAALAERPIVAPIDAGRMDASGQQQSQQQSQASAQQHGPAAHSPSGQAASDSQQRQQEPARPAGVQPQPREQADTREDEAAARTNPKRDTALFA